jgi:hypothetical protein
MGGEDSSDSNPGSYSSYSAVQSGTCRYDDILSVCQVLGNLPVFVVMGQHQISCGVAGCFLRNNNFLRFKLKSSAFDNILGTMRKYSLLWSVVVGLS